MGRLTETDDAARRCEACIRSHLCRCRSASRKPAHNALATTKHLLQKKTLEQEGFTCSDALLESD